MLALALACASVLFLAVLVARRLWLARGERLRAEAEARVQPLALELVEGERPEIDSLRDRDAHALALVLARYARQLRGGPRERIARFFEGRELVARELDWLRCRRPWRRALAARLLGDMCSERAAPALVAALQDGSRDVRMAAARSLGALGAVEAVDALVRALADGRLPRAAAGHALLAVGTGSLPQLRELAGDDDREVRASAVELIGLLGDASDAKLLMHTLHDASADVRAKAATALGRLGAEAGAAEVRTTLEDRIGFVRAAAAEALGAIGDRGAATALSFACHSDDFDEACAAAVALARVAPEVVQAVEVTAGPHGSPHLAEAADIALMR
jgi:HEAT repeat protein